MSVLLNADDKVKLSLIALFALTTSVFEVVTAAVIALFSQVLNDPAVGSRYMEKAGLASFESSGEVLIAFAILCGGVYFIKNVVVTIEMFFQNFSIQKMNYAFKNRLLERYAYGDYSEYLTRNSSFNTRVVGSDAELVYSTAMVAAATIFSETIVFVCLVSVIIYANPSLALFIFGIAAVIALVTAKWVMPLFYRWGKTSQEAGMMSWQNLLQFFHAFKEIILLGKRREFIDCYRRHSRVQARVRAVQGFANLMPRVIIEMLFVGLFVVTICFLSYTGQAPVSMMGTLGIYLYAGFRLMPGLNRIINQLSLFKSVIPSINRVYEEYTTVSCPESYADIPDFTFDSHIDVRNVGFRYKNVGIDTLKGVDFRIEKGERIGIVGETGSGKSTLVDVILGLLKPYEGHVRIDGKYPASCRQWHARIGYVSQAIYLTDDTIEANVALGVPPEDVDRDRLEEVMSAAQLDRLLDKLPEREKTVVGERGMRLSGGERQRIAIARAIYHRPDVLIFDEATSALDHDTEARVMDTMYDVAQGKTVIMIAHRLSTLSRCDRIIALENGRLKSVMSNNPPAAGKASA